MRKTLFTLAIIFISFTCFGQSVIHLTKVGETDTPKNHHGIIFGKFIQRLAFSSGGFPQYISLMNITSGQVYALRVKDTFRSSKHNFFCYYLAPGDYVILNYNWTQSKWYGGKQFIEPVYKRDAENLPPADATGSSEPEQYHFSIKKASINYVGTWNFESEIVSFTDEKLDMADKVKRCRHLDFQNADITLPK